VAAYGFLHPVLLIGGGSDGCCPTEWCHTNGTVHKTYTATLWSTANQKNRVQKNRMLPLKV
jgi:hypothetical protein